MFRLDLERPFPVNKVRWRVGPRTKDESRGIALAYIDARDVMKRLDDVCGVEGWQNRYTHVTPQGVVCEVGILFEGEWVWKANGAGETQVEGEKGAMSDAFKRAGVQWGIGRYLYALPNVWVELERGTKIIEPPTMPTWATPDGFDKIMEQKHDNH